MEKLTYRQAYDKIIDAYFKDEIRPMSMDFCFCGTLSGGCPWWRETITNQLYSLNEYKSMETALMIQLGAKPLETSWHTSSHRPYASDYEDRLFSGMTAALEVLKQIHRERGEDVDEVPGLTKRDLARTVTP